MENQWTGTDRGRGETEGVVLIQREVSPPFHAAVRPVDFKLDRQAGIGEPEQQPTVALGAEAGGEGNFPRLVEWAGSEDNAGADGIAVHGFSIAGQS